MEDDYTHKRFSNATSHLVFHWAAENEKWYQWYSITCSSIVMVPTAMAINRSFMCSPPCSKAHLSCFALPWLHLLLLFFRNIDVTVLMNREYCPKFQSDPKPLKIRHTNTRLTILPVFLQTCLSWSKLLV